MFSTFKKKYSYLEFVPYLQNNKKVRDVVFTSGDIKLIDYTQETNSPYEFSHQLVVDELRPDADINWDISENVNVRFRIDMKIHINTTQRMDIQFDLGARGMPMLKPIGWFPTRDMDGILISPKKARPIPYFSYLNNSVGNSCVGNS